MGTTLGVIGVFGFFACLIWLIVRLIRRKPAKPARTGLLVCVVLFFVGIGVMVATGEVETKNDADPPKQQEENTKNDDLEPEQPIELSSSSEKAEAQENLKSALGGSSVLFYDYVNNDVTGRWRMLLYYSAEEIVDHAVEYYDAYFESDDEVHLVVNLGLQTTSVITYAQGSLYIDVHEYIEDEELDAKILGGGMLLKSYIVNLTSGEIDDLSADGFIDSVSSTEADEYTIDLDTTMNVLDITLSQNFGKDYYTMEYDDAGVTINIWGDGIALGAVTAIVDESAKESWDFMVESQKGFCNTICEQVESTGIENYYVLLNVLNETDKDKALLSILNGVVIYDAVNG